MLKCIMNVLECLFDIQTGDTENPSLLAIMFDCQTQNTSFDLFWGPFLGTVEIGCVNPPGLEIILN